MTDGDSAADDGQSIVHRTKSALDRRRYLQALGAIGLLGAGSTTAAAEGNDRTVSLPDGDWERAADRRIREHRTADITVEVTDANGDPLEETEVAVEMREHAYGFGAAVNAGTLIEETSEGDNYRTYITELFNKAVLENHHKWRFWEANTELADRATDWILDRGLSMRGHVCLWANVSAWAVPPDVVRAMGMTWEAKNVTDPQLDPEYVRERTFDHIREIIDHYGDRIEEWEVHNETIHRPEFIEAINGIDPDTGELDFPAVEAPVLAEWYETAREVAPEGLPLAVNDYNVLAGPYEYARDAYHDEIEFLNGRGIGLGGIGMQCHFAKDQALTPTQTLRGLNEYAKYGAGLKVTEFDTADPNWSPEAKGEFLYRFLKTVYSHPATEDFILWGFWDGRHWKEDAPLFNEDWSKKPAYDAYTGLVHDEWWTDARGSAADGTFSTRAFLGDHDLTVSLADGDLQTDISLMEPTSRTLSVRVVDIDVRGAGKGRKNGVIPVRISDGESFDPAALDTETVRFGAPDTVNSGGGSELSHGSGHGNGSVMHFDAESNALDGGVAMLRGETDDGTLVVGFDRL